MHRFRQRIRRELAEFAGRVGRTDECDRRGTAVRARTLRSHAIRSNQVNPEQKQVNTLLRWSIRAIVRWCAAWSCAYGRWNQVWEIHSR